ELAASEHLLSSQVLYLPLVVITGNPLSAANLTAFFTYPLSGFLMERLLTSLGFWGVAAWIGGLVFALGPERLPANLHALQNANFFLPLAVLSLVRLKRKTNLARAIVFQIVFLGALFSSYYMAAMTTIVVVAWCAFECFRFPHRIGSFVGWVATSGAAAVAILALFSQPYFRQHG